jgi:hypothetical protein
VDKKDFNAAKLIFVWIFVLFINIF